MKTPSVHLLDTLFRLVFGVFLILFPVASLPIFFTPTLPRTALVVAMGMFSAFYLVVRWILISQIALTVTPFTVPFTLLTLVAAVSSALGHAPFLEALHGATGEWIAMLLVFLAAVESGRFSFVPLQIGAVLLSIIHLEAVFGFLKGFAALRFLSTETPWLPLKNPWVAVAFMAVGAITSGVSFGKRRRAGHIVAAAVSLSGILATLVLSFRQAIPTPVAPSFSASWYVAVETLRSRPLVGVGPGQYEDAFTAGRPISMNSHRGWDTVFETGSSEVLTLAAEMGMIGIIALTFLLTRMFIGAAWLLTSEAEGGLQPGSVASFALPLGTTMAALFLLPMRDAGWVLLVVFLARASHLLVERRALSVWLPFADANARPSSGIRPSLTASHAALLVFVLMLLALGVVRIGQALVSDYRMKLALELGERGRGSETYRLQSGIVADRPTNFSYRITFARTNLQVADALLKKIIDDNSLSQDDRQTVQKLLSDSITQAKGVTVSYPDRARGWRTLASIYRSLIAVNDNASTLALESYREAIDRDPTNPQLYRERGLVSYEVKNYDLAIEDFRRSASLKNDWADAWFDLGRGYEMSQKREYARQAYRQAEVLWENAGADSESIASDALQRLDEPLTPTPTPIRTPTPTPSQSSGSSATPAHSPSPSPAPTGGN
jgi:tetratricopeptide (TPR) repeat protein